MFRLTFLHQIFCQLCFCLKDFIKIVRLVLASVSINGLRNAFDNTEKQVPGIRDLLTQEVFVQAVS